MIKTNFPGNPVILGIGDGFDDFLMMQNCDVSIQVLSKNSKVSSAVTKSGDIIVTNFNKISSLIFGRNQIISKKIHSIILFNFYIHFIISWPFFLFCWYSNFSANYLSTEVIGLFIFFIISKVLSL